MVTVAFIICTTIALYFTVRLIQLSSISFVPWVIYAFLVMTILIRRILVLVEADTANDPGLYIIIAILLAVFPWSMWRALKS